MLSFSPCGKSPGRKWYPPSGLALQGKKERFAGRNPDVNLHLGTGWQGEQTSLVGELKGTQLNVTEGLLEKTCWPLLLQRGDCREWQKEAEGQEVWMTGPATLGPEVPGDLKQPI